MTVGRTPSVALAVLLLVMPGCSITWREPQLEPLNTNRFYDADLEATCDAAQSVVEGLGLEVDDSQREERACLIATDYKVLADAGEDPLEHLGDVALIGPGPFIGGRYTVTVTGRGSRDGGTRLKVVTRIEGYINQEFGYQVLRSTGLIEERVFERVGSRLGAEPQLTR